MFHIFALLFFLSLLWHANCRIAFTVLRVCFGCIGDVHSDSFNCSLEAHALFSARILQPGPMRTCDKPKGLLWRSQLWVGSL